MQNNPDSKKNIFILNGHRNKKKLIEWMLNATVTLGIRLQAHALSCIFDQNNLVTITVTHISMLCDNKHVNHWDMHYQYVQRN